MSGERIVDLDLSDLQRFGDNLKAGAQAAIKEAWKALSAWGEEYKRRVQRVTPVDEGHARQSWVTVRDEKEHSVTVGNTIKGNGEYESYVKYLEYGTDRIAGGRVKAWKPGDDPITSWPAKNEPLPSLRGMSPGDKHFERYTNVLDKAFRTGTGEQMPMLRPIGYEIAPEVAKDVKEAYQHGFKSVVDRRKGNK